jgi:hemoglobin-like flavoprotein
MIRSDLEGVAWSPPREAGEYESSVGSESELAPEEIELVRSVLRALGPSAEVTGWVFYARLFQLAPSVRPLFSDDLGRTGLKLLAMLQAATDHVGALGRVASHLRSLGKRHRALGVKDADYDAAGDALLWTLRCMLGRDLTSEAERACARAYAVVAATMSGSR